MRSGTTRCLVLSSPLKRAAYGWGVWAPFWALEGQSATTGCRLLSFQPFETGGHRRGNRGALALDRRWVSFGPGQPRVSAHLRLRLRQAHWPADPSRPRAVAGLSERARFALSNLVILHGRASLLRPTIAVIGSDGIGSRTHKPVRGRPFEEGFFACSDF